MMIKPDDEVHVDGGQRFRVTAVMPFEEEDESPFVGVLEVEAAQEVQKQEPLFDSFWKRADTRRIPSRRSRGMRKPSPSMIVALIALFVALSGVGMAANGGNFILGHSNTASLNTSLSAPVAGGKALQVTNSNTSNAASTALGLNVAAGHAPFTVNSAVKVTNLNADTLDGIDSSALIQGKGKVYTLAVSIPRLNSGYNPYMPSPAVAPGFFNLKFYCPDLNTPRTEDGLYWFDNSGAPTNLFVTNSHFAPIGAQWLPEPRNGYFGIGIANPDLTTLTIQGRPPSTGLLTITTATISTVVRDSDCHFQVQALTTTQ